MELKQAIVVRTDVGMGKGKMATQSSHASLLAYQAALKKNKKAVSEWENGGMKKIALRAGSESELLGLFEKAKNAKLPCALVHDSGFTQLAPGTVTALGIGPAEEKKVDGITGKLKLL